MAEPRPVLRLPAREIPVPTSVSPEAQGVLGMPAMEQPDFPPVDDVDAWRTMIADHDQTIAALMQERTADAPVKTHDVDIDGVHVYVITPDEVTDDDRRVYLDIHGGAFVHGRGESCRAMSIGTALRVGARVWSVDYRMPPDHPFPAALDDCITAYPRWCRITLRARSSSAARRPAGTSPPR